MNIVRLLMIPFGLLLFSSLYAQDAGRYISKSGSFDEDLYLVGRDINVDGVVNGDVITSGGQIVIDDTVNGDLIAAGGTIRVKANILDDARLAGAEVIVSGSIEDDLIAGGGNIQIEKNARVGGRAWIGGGKVDIDGVIGKELKVSAGDVVIRGKIRGDVHIKADHIEILPSAIIEGDLYHQSEHEVIISPDAKIRNVINEQKSAEKSSVWALIGFVLFVFFFLSLGVLIASLVVYFIFPRLFSSTSMMLDQAFIQSAGLGALIFFMTPIFILVLMATIIGIPLAVLLIFLYGLILVVGLFSFIYYFSDCLLKWWNLKSDDSVVWRITSIALALLIIIVVKMIPLIGPLFVLLGILAGMGGFVLQVFQRRSVGD